MTSRSRSQSPNRSGSASDEPLEREPTSPPQSPSPPQSTSRSGAARSESSSAGSSAEFVTDPGPAFDPRSAPAAPLVEEEEGPGILEEWDEQRIREFLVLQGEVTHALLAVGPEDTETWLQTEQDLGSIAPPLTRIMNRYDVTRAAAAAGDEILLVTAVGRYGLRNYSKRRRLLKLQAAAEPQPITGVPAEPDSGPESDEEWQRVHQAPPALVPKGKRR